MSKDNGKTNKKPTSTNKQPSTNRKTPLKPGHIKKTRKKWDYPPISLFSILNRRTWK